MARRPRVFAPGLLYHVMVRGNHRQKTFLGARDYQAYLDRLARYRKQYAAIIYAYCLMPNHVHLLVETTGASLAKFMQGVQQSYTLYFNRVHDTVGHLFQGRYKAIICDRDAYLLALIRYIHLNPVRASLVTAPDLYRYSSHQTYLHGREAEVLDPTGVLTLFGGRGEYRSFVLDGIGAGHRPEYYAVEEQQFLGSAEFRKHATPEKDSPLPRQPKRALSAVVKAMTAHLELEPSVLAGGDRSWPVCAMRSHVLYAVVRRGGFSVTEVAKHFRRDPATISSAITRFAQTVESDERVSKMVAELAEIV
ncbi:MAG: transposase [Nitrospirae bacterium]|nr:transposase [Nitrospirota bacterium]